MGVETPIPSRRASRLVDAWLILPISTGGISALTPETEVVIGHVTELLHVGPLLSLLMSLMYVKQPVYVYK